MNEPIKAHQAIERAVAAQAGGQNGEAMRWLDMAQEAGMGRSEIAKTLLDCVIAIIDDESEPLPRKTSPVLEVLSQSAQQIRSRCYELKSTISSDNPVRESILLLDTEINILQQELALSVSRSQFQIGARPTRRAPASLEELNEFWQEDIRASAVSQLGQDLWVLERCSYKRGGFFVEFGATNGILLSNTWLLEQEFGWNGLCAEPNPRFFEQLKRNRLCTVSTACIGPITGEVVDFVFADVFGGMLRDIDKDQHKANRESYRDSGATARLTTVSLDDFLREYNAPRTIDFLSIDTEGSEFSIIETFPFDQWDIRHITVEHNQTEQRQLIRNHLTERGYSCKEADWDDWYYLPAP